MSKYSKNDPAVEWLSSLVRSNAPRDYLLEQAGKLLINSNQISPPFEPIKALPSCVKKVELAKLTRDGMLVVTEGGFVIRLNSEKPKVRQRFALAHEIGHTYFYDCSGQRPWRPYESLSSYWFEEHLCYEFAEEMLMPHQLLHEVVHPKMTPSIMNLYGLARTFSVSVEAMARRVIGLGLWQCIIVLRRSDENNNAYKRPVICKHIVYKSHQINWDSLFFLANNNLVNSSPREVKHQTIDAPSLFRNCKRNENWIIESSFLQINEFTTSILMIIPKTSLSVFPD